MHAYLRRLRRRKRITQADIDAAVAAASAARARHDDQGMSRAIDRAKELRTEGLRREVAARRASRRKGTA